MNDLDKWIRDYPFQTIMLATLAVVQISEGEWQRLTEALERKPDWKDCLCYQYEKGRHEELLRLQETNLRKKKEEEDREKIRRFVWGKDKEKP